MSDYFEKDDVVGKAYDYRLMKRLMEFVWPHRKLALWGILIGVFSAIFRILVPILQGMVVRDLNPSGEGSGFIDSLWLWMGGSPQQKIGSLLYLLAFLFFLTITLRFILEAMQTYILQYFGQKAIYDLRMKLFQHLLDLPMDFHHKNPVGRLVTRVSNDVESLNEFVSTGLTNLVRHLFTVVSISIVLPIIAWKLGLIALGLLPLVILASLVFRHYARQMYRRLRKQISLLNAFLAENIAGMFVIRAFSKEEQQREKFLAINEELRKNYIATIRTWALYAPTVSFLEGLCLAVIIYFGHHYVTGGELNLATLSVFIWLIHLYYEPIKEMAEKYNILQSAMASSERIFNILDAQEDPTLQSPRQEITFSSPPRIEFRDLCFSYSPDKPVLKNVNITIEPGQTVALVGHTGAGKSTFIKLLLRFYDPTSGEIWIEDKRLQDLHPKDWRSHLAVVPQDVFLFLGSIQENIGLWNEDISPEEIRKSAEYVQAHRFIEKYKEGYSHELKEGAKTLSSGERQLLSFARALAYHPSILILDEATALIDTQTEKLIQKGLKKLIEGRTTLIIAHRLSTIQEADKIVVLQKGEIAEVGNHQELLALRGLYYGLYQLQYS